MTEGLFDRITNASNESLRNIFNSLNLSGYDYIEQLKFNDKDNVVRYVAYAYTYNSDRIRKSKDRNANKIDIARHVGLDTNNITVKQILKNEIDCVNQFISWWLIETAHPLFARYISGCDLESEKLEIIRNGLQLSFTAKDTKQMDNFVKNATKDSKLKSQAFFDVVKIREQIDKDFRELQKWYERLFGEMKEEMPTMFDGVGNMQEFIAMKSDEKRKVKRNSLLQI